MIRPFGMEQNYSTPRKYKMDPRDKSSEESY